MIAIGDVLVSDDVISSYFACELNACKGACCIEGDYGAPLTIDEVEILNDLLPILEPYLSQDSLELIKEKGAVLYHEETEGHVTNLMPNGACVFMGRDEMGIAYCGIEKAYMDGKTNFRKPISCHLYPIRVNENPHLGFTAVNYHRWDICTAACGKGKKEKILLYKFLKEPIIRKFGESFYEELCAAADYLSENSPG